MTFLGLAPWSYGRREAARPLDLTCEGGGRVRKEVNQTVNQPSRAPRHRLVSLAVTAGLLLTLAVPGIASANYEYTQGGTTYTVSYDGSGKITVTGSNGSTWTGQGVQSNGHYVPPSDVGGMTTNGGTPYQSGNSVTTDWSTGTKPVANNGGCPAGETPVTANGQSGCIVDVNTSGVQTTSVQQGSMVIISGSTFAQTQDQQLVQGAQIVTIPSNLLTPSPGESQQQQIAAIDQYLQLQGVSTSALATVVGGTGVLPPIVDQAVSDYTQAAAIQVGGANALDGAAALTQLASTFASGGLAAVSQDLNMLAGIATSMQTSSSTNPWTGTGSGAYTGGGTASRSSPTSPWTYTQSMGGVSLYQAPTTSAVTSGGGGGGGGSCPPGELGTPPNCYTPVHNPPPPPPQQASQWYAVAIPAWMDSWLNVVQQPGNGDQTASNHGNSNYVASATSDSHLLTSDGGTVLNKESAQVFGSYTVTTTQTETKYQTVTVPVQETRMVAETQTVPGYWHDVSFTEPGDYSTVSVEHPGYYTSEPVYHSGSYSSSTVSHPGYYSSERSCSAGYYSTQVVWIDRDGRMERSTQRVWHPGSCTTRSIYHPGYTSTVQVWHPGYTTTEQVWHPAYTTTEQVYHPPYTVTHAVWVPPTTQTVQVPQTYTAYVTEQQPYTVSVPVTETLTGWHTVTSQVATGSQGSGGTNSGGNLNGGHLSACGGAPECAQPAIHGGSGAVNSLYVAPVNSQNNPWL